MDAALVFIALETILLAVLVGIAWERGGLIGRFYKADRARVRGGGRGIGLSIARHGT